MIVALVRFRTGLSDEEVEARFEARADGYRTLPGLVEKLYLRYREPGEFGAVYVWESEDALTSFRESELGRTIGDAYRTMGDPHIEIADVRLVVQPRKSGRPPSA